MRYVNSNPANMCFFIQNTHVLLSKLCPEFIALGTKHFLKKVLKKTFIITPFYGWGSPVKRLQNHYGEKVYFLPLSPRSSCTHLIDLGRMKI